MMIIKEIEEITKYRKPNMNEERRMTEDKKRNHQEIKKKETMKISAINR